MLGTTVLLVVDPYFFELLEGEEGTYTVRLAADPMGDVTVVAGQAASALPLTAGADFLRRAYDLQFDANNWATAQPVTVHSTKRVNATAGRDQFTHEVTGAVMGSSTASVGVQEILDTVPILGAVADRTVSVGQAVNVWLGAGVQTVRGGPDAPGEGTDRAIHAATDPDEGVNAPLRYRLTGPETDLPNNPVTTLTLPAGLRFDAARRRLVGRPQVTAAAATYRLTVEDAQGDTNELEVTSSDTTQRRTFTLTVEGNPLGFSSGAERYTRGATYTLPAPDVAMGTMPVLTFVVEPALPAGLTYEPPAEAQAPYTTGGRIVGTPTGGVPTVPYTLTVIDVGSGNEAELRFALAVAPPPPPTQPEPTEPEPGGGPSCGDAVVPAQVYRAGEAIAAVVLPAATGGTGPLRYGVGPEIPAGLTYTAPADPTATGGVLTGVPTAAQAATALLTFTIRVAGPGQIRGQAGTRTYALGGRTVTVTQAAGTLAGVELTLPGQLAEDVAITLAPPGAEVPLAGGRYRFGPADAQAAVAVAVTPVPAGGLDVCVPVSAAVRAAARERAVQLVRYVGGKWTRWARVADAEAEAARVCAAGMTWFGPLAAGYPNTVPTFGEQTIAARTGMVAATLAPVELPAAAGGDGPVRYRLEPALPTGLSYTLPTESAAGAIAGVPTEAQPPTEYTLTATDIDGDAATLAFTLAVEREPVQVSIADATATEGAAVEFPVTLSRAVAKPVTVEWTAGAPGSATPGEDYRAEAAGRLVLAAGTTTGTLAVPTLDDRRVEPTETFRVTVTLPADPLFERADATAEGRIEDDDTEQARKRSVGMVLAGVGRTLATDAVDVIGARFVRQPPTPQATVGGQALNLHRDGDTARWRQAAGVAYGVARALGVEVGSPLEGGAGEFGQVRGAAWSALTRHLADPGAATVPRSAWDTPGAFATPPGGPGLDGLSSAAWGTPSRASAAPSFPPAPSTGSGDREGARACPGPNPGGSARAGRSKLGWRHPVRERPAARLSRLRPRVRARRLRPRPCRNAPGAESRHVPGTGAVPARVGGGGAGAERVRDPAAPSCGGPVRGRGRS